MAREWLKTKDWEDVTKNRRLDMLERVVFGEIGQVPLRAITPAHVLGILQHTVKRGAPTVAAEARRTMSPVFEYAVATAQIGGLLNDFDNHRCTFQINYCMQLMWWTLARPSEVAEAERTEIDLERAQWRIPAERMKARKEHVVPLPTQAVEMLRGLKANSGQRKHLFPPPRVRLVVASVFE